MQKSKRYFKMSPENPKIGSQMTTGRDKNQSADDYFQHQTKCSTAYQSNRIWIFRTSFKIL